MHGGRISDCTVDVDISYDKNGSGWASDGGSIISPSSSAATALPGVTRPISRFIAKGGHWTWTHSLVGFVIAAFLTYDLTFWTVTVNGVDVRPGNGVVLGLLLAIARFPQRRRENLLRPC